MIASHARSCAVRGGALRVGLGRQVCGAVRVQAFATGGAITHAVPLVSDLVLRALLRNMKLLVGQRGDKKRFKVLLVAPHDIVGSHLAKLEPALDIQTVRMDEIDGHRGADLDGVIISQLYHTLASPTQLASIRAALDDEEGTLGFMWSRALDSTDVTSAVTAAVTKAAPGGAASLRPDLHAPLAAEQTPLLWVEALNLPSFQFKPAKHRKFVDSMTPSSAAQAADWLRLTHDARFPATGAGTGAAGAAWAAAQAALSAAEAGGAFAPGAGRAGAIAFDLHGFHSSVVPSGDKKKKQPAPPLA